jgi:hypothetical protein
MSGNYRPQPGEEDSIVETEAMPSVEDEVYYDEQDEE